MLDKEAHVWVKQVGDALASFTAEMNKLGFAARKLEGTLSPDGSAYVEAQFVLYPPER